jgi:hypothetical protein
MKPLSFQKKTKQRFVILLPGLPREAARDEKPVPAKRSLQDTTAAHSRKAANKSSHRPAKQVVNRAENDGCDHLL